MLGVIEDVATGDENKKKKQSKQFDKEQTFVVLARLA